MGRATSSARTNSLWTDWMSFTLPLVMNLSPTAGYLATLFYERRVEAIVDEATVTGRRQLATHSAVRVCGTVRPVSVPLNTLLN
jgi:hypothetical protein